MCASLLSHGVSPKRGDSPELAFLGTHHPHLLRHILVLGSTSYLVFKKFLFILDISFCRMSNGVQDKQDGRVIRPNGWDGYPPRARSLTRLSYFFSA